MKTMHFMFNFMLCTFITISAYAIEAPPLQTTSIDTEIRAIWVTRGSYKSPEDIQKIIQNCADYNLNVILFQVRGNGTVYYDSKIEPWAWELSGSPDKLGENPGWDPLQVAIDEAHSRQMLIYAWLNTFPAWQGVTDPPANVPQLWNTHRDWFMVDKNGSIMEPQGKNLGWYRFISPGIPAVQDYLRDVYTEVVQNYAVDGIHFDYVRHPGEIGDYSYDSISLSRFKKQTGNTPDEAPEAWDQFRRDNVSSVVRKTYNSVTAINPHVAVTAAVVGKSANARFIHYSSARDWMKEGTMDIIMTMTYVSDLASFRSMNKDHIDNAHGRFVCPGIGVSQIKTPEDLIEQIETARMMGAQGVTFFAYHSLFPHHEAGDKARALLSGPFKNKALTPELTWKQFK